MMPQNINREQVQQMIEQGAQLVEVLGRFQYRQLHLPKAINIPLQSLDRDTAGKLQKNRPIIVYYHDYQ
jgi:rhodanese-related sulfurtransferase